MIVIASMARADDHRRACPWWQIKMRIERITGLPALITHFSDINPEFLARYGFRAMFITGTGYDWALVPVKDTWGMSDVLHNVDIPVLGACGGHQLIGWVFNHNVRKLTSFRDEPMRKLKPKEPDLVPSYHPGYYVESGVQPIEVLQRDPIFDGLGKRFKAPESHYCEIKKLPPGFVHLARNDNCEIQCIRHAERPLYGAQFHAENWTDAYPDGRRFITNFFRIAGLVD